MISVPKKAYVLYIPDYNKYVTGVSDKYVLMKSDKNEALHFSSESNALDFIKANKLKSEDYRVVCLSNSFQLIINLFLLTSIVTLSLMENDPVYYFSAKVIYNVLIFVAIVFNGYYLKEWHNSLVERLDFFILLFINSE